MIGQSACHSRPPLFPDWLYVSEARTLQVEKEAGPNSASSHGQAAGSADFGRTRGAGRGQWGAREGCALQVPTRRASPLF